MKAANVLVWSIAALCALASFAFGFWPLSVIAIALLVLYGHTTVGLALALFFDLIYGVPPGIFGLLYFPFFILGCLCVVLRGLALRFVLERGVPDAL